MRLTTIAAAIAAGAIVAPASASIIAEFNLDDHPGGAGNPPPYGLRLDGLIGNITTFSLGFFGDSTLTVDDDLGGLRITMSGTLWGGEVVSHAYVDPKAYDFEFVWVDGVEATATGWRVLGSSTNNGGSITEQGGSTENLLTSIDGFCEAFVFQADGDRIPGDDTTWVGRGWAKTTTAPQTGPQDWLFTAEPVPTPASGMLMLAGSLLAFRRKR